MEAEERGNGQKGWLEMWLPRASLATRLNGLITILCKIVLTVVAIRSSDSQVL